MCRVLYCLLQQAVIQNERADGIVRWLKEVTRKKASAADRRNLNSPFLANKTNITHRDKRKRHNLGPIRPAVDSISSGVDQAPHQRLLFFLHIHGPHVPSRTFFYSVNQVVHFTFDSLVECSSRFSPLDFPFSIRCRKNAELRRLAGLQPGTSLPRNPRYKPPCVWYLVNVD